MKKKRSLVVFPPDFCTSVPNDGTYQDKYHACIDRYSLVPVDAIWMINHDVQETLKGNGIEWKIEHCWASACIIHLLDENDIALVKLHWGNQGVIFKEE